MAKKGARVGKKKSTYSNICPKCGREMGTKTVWTKKAYVLLHCPGCGHTKKWNCKNY